MLLLISLVVGFILSRIFLGLGVKFLELVKLKEGNYTVKDAMFFSKNISWIKRFLVDVFSILSVYYILINISNYSNVGLLMLIIILFLLLMSMITDLLDGYILNIFTFSGIFLIGILNFMEASRLENIWIYVIGFMLVVVMFGIIFLIMPGKMGLGDVKLFLLLGVYFGIFDLIVVMFLGTFLGLIYGVYQLLIKKENGAFVFGPFISYGALIVLLFDLSLPLM